jgi:hypothetical protein
MIENFIWQYLDVPEDEILAVQASARASLPDNNISFQGLSLEKKLTHFMGVAVKHVILIQIQPNFFGIIHTDWPKGTNGLALNIPLENCETTPTIMWESDKDPVLKKLVAPDGTEIKYYFYPPENCRKIDEFTVTRPILWNPGILHNVDNSKNDKWRRAISIRFIEDPWHLIK